ncbi:MAG: hypothetical protein ACR2RL_23700, partial [Gammaproteobacteria bacterium]
MSTDTDRQVPARVRRQNQAASCVSRCARFKTQGNRSEKANSFQRLGNAALVSQHETMSSGTLAYDQVSASITTVMLACTS